MGCKHAKYFNSDFIKKAKTEKDKYRKKKNEKGKQILKLKIVQIEEVLPKMQKKIFQEKKEKR